MTPSTGKWKSALIGMIGLVQALVPASALAAGDGVWSFESDSIGAVPEGWVAGKGKWKVTEDLAAPDKGHVLAQLARNASSAFNVILASETNYRDVDISVKMKSLTGTIDQGGGVVWRATDQNNYYIARYNPLEDNFRVYKVVNGHRRKLRSARIKHRSGWHTLRVKMQGAHVECFFDGKKYLDVRDETFPQGGRVGVWTKADAVTYFDDLKVSERNAVR